jgi:hypothetical protein
VVATQHRRVALGIVVVLGTWSPLPLALVAKAFKHGLRRAVCVLLVQWLHRDTA